MKIGRLHILALVYVMLTCAMTVRTFAQQTLADPALEARARALSKELRCVVCQNQSIDESTAPLAMDLKALLRKRLVDGDSDTAAKAFLVQRYGNFVLLKPPFQFNTLLLWLGPLILFAGALLASYRYFTGHSDDLAASDRNVPLAADEERRIAKALAGEPS